MNRSDHTREVQTWQLQLEVAGKILAATPQTGFGGSQRFSQGRRTSCAEELKDAKEWRVFEDKQTRRVTNELTVGGSREIMYKESSR